MQLLELDESPGLGRRDEEAFNRLYDSYFHHVYRFAYSKLQDRADTEDAVQEIFIAVFQSLDSFEGKASLLSWIYGIARNVVNSQIRRSRAEARRVHKTDSGLVRSASSLDLCTPEQTLGLRRCAAALEKQLGEVSDWQAEAFEMRHLDDLPIQEIANRVERSNNAVRSSLCRVKQLVFEAMDAANSTIDEGRATRDSAWRIGVTPHVRSASTWNRKR